MKDNPRTHKGAGDKCDRCGSNQLFHVSGKTSDMCWVKRPDGKEADGYVPTNLRIAGPSDGGDYINFVWCEPCGQMYLPPK